MQSGCASKVKRQTLAWSASKGCSRSWDAINEYYLVYLRWFFMDIGMKRLYEVRSTIKAFNDILDSFKGTLKADIRSTRVVCERIRYLIFYFDMHFNGSIKKKKQKRKERICYNDRKFMRETVERLTVPRRRWFLNICPKQRCHRRTARSRTQWLISVAFREHLGN